MIDHARRMLGEALARIHDADLLSQSLSAESNSDAFLRILGFEILLKCAVLISGQQPSKSHKYTVLWNALRIDTRKQIVATANLRMPGHADLSDIEKLLNWYQFIFERARYHYELYEKYTLDEQHQLGELWRELGAPSEEAMVQYYPRELICLIHGLQSFIEAALPNLSLNPDASPAALARRPLGAG